jgi:hypothetical protein
MRTKVTSQTNFAIPPTAIHALIKVERKENGKPHKKKKLKKKETSTNKLHISTFSVIFSTVQVSLSHLYASISTLIYTGSTLPAAAFSQ